MNNKLKIGAAFIIASSMFAGSANAAGAVTENATASVTILAPITVTQATEMAFGKVTSPATTGTVPLDSSGSLGTLTGGIASIGGTTAAGSMTITGDDGNVMDITVADTTSVAGLSLGSFTGTFGGGTLSGGTITGATIDASGTETFNIGATLTIDSQAVGYSTGLKALTYDVTVEYQ